MRKREACCGREQFPVRYNKAVRASSIRRRMELRGLCVSARANRRGAWTGPPRSFLITRAKNLYDQKTPKGHQNFTLRKYKPSPKCTHKSRLFGNRWLPQTTCASQCRTRNSVYQEKIASGGLFH